MNISDLTQAAWFEFLEPDQQQAVYTSLELLEREKKLRPDFADFSYVLFPISKAYEGFLKKFLFTQGLISAEVYQGRHFRIGRALNPDISPNQRDQWWLYDDVVRNCGNDLAREMWKSWIECRNHVFHYFPKFKNELSLQKVEDKMAMLISVFEKAQQCVVKK
jgi:hypothetical protein